MNGVLNPQIGDRLFFINNEVIVVQLFEVFQLAKIRYINSFKTFIVDVHCLSEETNERSSISIKLLGGTGG
jgi:hypothetical protein